MDFLKKYIEAIKACKTDEEIAKIINRIYEDGFYDGFEDGKNEPPEPADSMS